MYMPGRRVLHVHVHAEYVRSRESTSVIARVTYVPQAVRDETGVEDDEQMMREPEHLEVRPPAQQEHGDVNLGKNHSTSHCYLLRSLRTCMYLHTQVHVVYVLPRIHVDSKYMISLMFAGKYM